MAELNEAGDRKFNRLSAGTVPPETISLQHFIVPPASSTTAAATTSSGEMVVESLKRKLPP